MNNPIKAWSYSRWQVYEQCPAKFKYKFIDKLPDPPSPQMERGLQIHKEGERFILEKDYPLAEEYAQFAEEMHQLKDMQAFAEQEWAFTDQWERTGWFAKDTWLRVKVDAGVVYRDNTADIIDHKTGKRYGENRDQMELFALATFKHFHSLSRVMTRLWYLDSGEEDVAEFKSGDVARLQRKWERNVEPMFTDTRFAPRPNDKCRWCPFSASAGGPCQYG